jgi:hypothetical protein
MKYIISGISIIIEKSELINAAVLPSFKDGITTKLFDVKYHSTNTEIAAIPVVPGYENYYNAADIAASQELTPDWNDIGWALHTQIMRAWISDEQIRKISISQYYSIITYIHSSTVELDSTKTGGLYAYFNYILPEHEAIFQNFGITIENRNL